PVISESLRTNTIRRQKDRVPALHFSPWARVARKRYVSRAKSPRSQWSNVRTHAYPSGFSNSTGVSQHNGIDEGQSWARSAAVLRPRLTSKRTSAHVCPRRLRNDRFSRSMSASASSRHYADIGEGRCVREPVAS